MTDDDDFDPSKWVFACAICGEHITSFEMLVTHAHAPDDVPLRDSPEHKEESP